MVVLGGINMDLTGVAQNLPMPGETVVGQRFYTSPGGKGANQAVAAARLGARARMVGRVGDDAFGRELLAGLQAQEVSIEGVAIDKENPSGVAMILLDSLAQNHIVAVYGANAACDAAQLDAARGALEEADALLLQLEIPFHISLEAARAARSHGVRVIWDPAPAFDMPQEAYDVADVLVPNETEAEVITGLRVTDSPSATAAAQMLLSRGVALAVVKLGEQGVVYASHEEIGVVPAFDVEVVDTVAAGDAFAAALAVALSEGSKPERAVKFAAAAGAVAVSRAGAQSAMPGRAEVEELFGRSL